MTSAPQHGLLLSWLRLRAESDPEHSCVETMTLSVTDAEFLKLAEERLESLAAQGDFRNMKVGALIRPTPTSLATLVALEALGAEVLLLNSKAVEAELQGMLEEFGASYFMDSDSLTTPTALNRPAGTGALGTFAMVTSGTTGRARVVRRQWSKLMLNAQAFAKAASYTPEDRILCTTPLHHSYAFSTAWMSSLVSGATLLFTSEKGRPTYAVSIARERRATVVQAIPFVYQNLVQNIPDFRGVRLFLSAGERLDPKLMKEWQSKTGRGLTNHYGTTELGMLTLSEEGDIESVGFALPGVEFRIQPLHDASGVGELQVLMPNPAGPTSSAVHWAGTGDLAVLMEDGRVFLKGRLIPLLNLAGNKIDPLEIEQALLEFAPIQECLVLGRDGPDGNTESLEALIALKSEATETAIRAHLASKLSAHKIPRNFRIVDQLPRTSTGKILRGIL